MAIQNQQVEQAKAVRARHETELMAHRGVVSVGVGLRQRGGQTLDEVCIVVMVRHKRPFVELPATESLPTELDGIPVDVQESGDIAAR